MTKIVKNVCFGGFGLSPEAEIEYLRRKRGGVYAYKRYSDSSPDRYEKISLEEYEGHIDEALTHVDHGNDVETENLEGYFYDKRVDRDDPVLAEVVEEMGEESDGEYAQLTIVEVPDDVDWFIDEYDGQEVIREAHRTW